MEISSRLAGIQAFLSPRVPSRVRVAPPFRSRSRRSGHMTAAASITVVHYPLSVGRGHDILGHLLQRAGFVQTGLKSSTAPAPRYIAFGDSVSWSAARLVIERLRASGASVFAFASVSNPTHYIHSMLHGGVAPADANCGNQRRQCFIGALGIKCTAATRRGLMGSCNFSKPLATTRGQSSLDAASEAAAHSNLGVKLLSNVQCRRALGAEAAATFGNRTACSAVWADLVATLDWIGTTDDVSSTLEELVRVVHNQTLEKRLLHLARSTAPARVEVTASFPGVGTPAELQLSWTSQASDWAFYYQARKQHCTSSGAYLERDDAKEREPRYRWPETHMNLRFPNAGYANCAIWAKAHRQSLAARQRWIARPSLRCPALDGQAQLQVTQLHYCRAIGGKRILFIGDSVHRSAFTSLSIIASSGDPEPIFPKLGGGVGDGPLHVCNGSASLQFLSNDYLLTGGLPTYLLSHGVFMQQRNGDIEALLRDEPAFDVIVMSTGAHLVRKWVEESHAVMLTMTALAIREHLASAAPAPQIYFRTPNLGHADCRLGDSRMHPPHVRYEPPLPDPFGWRRLPDVSRLFFEVFESVIPGQVRYIDGQEQARPRKDSHIGRVKTLHGPERPDCLHYCLPGPPDDWNDMLIRRMLADHAGHDVQQYSSGAAARLYSS